MIAANELDKTVEIFEIKRNRKNIDLTLLREKVSKMLTTLQLFNGYTIRTEGLDMRDM